MCTLDRSCLGAIHWMLTLGFLAGTANIHNTAKFTFCMTDLFRFGKSENVVITLPHLIKHNVF